jgi:hypothetical protein
MHGLHICPNSLQFRCKPVLSVFRQSETDRADRRTKRKSTGRGLTRRSTPPLRIDFVNTRPADWCSDFQNQLQPMSTRAARIQQIGIAIPTRASDSRDFYDAKEIGVAIRIERIFLVHRRLQRPQGIVPRITWYLLHPTSAQA